MITHSPQVNYTHHSFQELIDPLKRSDNILTQAILANWFDGVLILTEQGRWIQANETARRICDRLSPGSPFSGQAPKPIWRVCQALIRRRRKRSQTPIRVESALRMNESDYIRIRARWFKFGEDDGAHLLVILEDRGQSIQNQAFAEVDQYGLTPREAEVWLLHRADYAYKEIAAELYITIHTVKKHMRNIRMKRQLANVMADYRHEEALELN